MHYHGVKPCLHRSHIVVRNWMEIAHIDGLQGRLREKVDSDKRGTGSCYLRWTHEAHTVGRQTWRVAIQDNLVGVDSW